jgi:3-deoxy-D-manno-octulosonate 8-phosphate phosphatase (KDO 8-P phosphatase)
MQTILVKHSVSVEQAAFMGDDLPDLTAMQHAGFAIAPKTAVAAVLDTAHYVPSLPAGAGAVRELCDLIIAAQEVT